MEALAVEATDPRRENISSVRLDGSPSVEIVHSEKRDPGCWYWSCTRGTGRLVRGGVGDSLVVWNSSSVSSTSSSSSSSSSESVYAARISEIWTDAREVASSDGLCSSSWVLTTTRGLVELMRTGALILSGVRVGELLFSRLEDLKKKLLDGVGEDD